MSRLWSSSGQYVYVADDHLAIAKVKGGFSPSIVSKQFFPFQADDPLAVQGALLKWLVKQEESSPKVFFTLGHAHVRYFMLPWDRQLCDSHFRGVMANAFFERLFQQPAAGYRVLCAEPQYGRALLVAAVSVELLTALTVAVKQCKGLVKSVEPLLSAVWRRFEPGISSVSGGLMVVEPQRVLRVAHEQGHLRRVVMHPFKHDEARFLLEGADGDQKVFAPHLTEGAFGGAGHLLSLNDVSGFSPARDALYAFALCEVT